MLKKITLGTIGILLTANLAFALNEPHKVKILETADAGTYTYIKVEENGEQYWAAIMKAPVKIGDTITIKEQVWMNNFKSTALNKTFDKVLFADIQREGISGADNIHSIHGDMIKKKQEHAYRPDPKFNEGLVISNDQPQKTNITEIFNNAEKYKNKNVEIEGEVIQVSDKVMGNTWVKIYDGKDSLIFRSPNEDEKVSIGNKVKVIGTINTDIDYGYGFSYKIIGVNGKFTVIN